MSIDIDLRLFLGFFGDCVGVVGGGGGGVEILDLGGMGRDEG